MGEMAVLVFAVELQKLPTKCIFPIFEGGLGRVSKWHVLKGEESVKKSIFTEFTSRYQI